MYYFVYEFVHLFIKLLMIILYTFHTQWLWWIRGDQGMREVLEDVGLKKEDLLVFLTDHEGAIRKAAKEFCTVVGCGCHGLQLPMRHVLPATKTRSTGDAGSPKLAVAPAAVVDRSESSSDSSDSDSDSSRDSSSDSDSAAETASPVAAAAGGGDGAGVELPPAAGLVADAPAHGGQTRKRKHIDTERAALTQELTPLFAKGRRLVKWFIHHDTVYNSLEDLCQSNMPPIAFKRFPRETATRWNSQTGQLCGVLYNEDAVAIGRSMSPYFAEKQENHERMTVMKNHVLDKILIL